MNPDELHKQYHSMSPETKEALSAIKDDMHDMRYNHLAHIEKSVGSIEKEMTNYKQELSIVRTDMKWMKLIGGFVIAQGIVTLTAVLVK